MTYFDFSGNVVRVGVSDLTLSLTLYCTLLQFSFSVDKGNEVSVHSWTCILFVHRQWNNEQEADLGEGAGSARPPGLAVQKEREQRLPGYQMEEVLVCAEEDGSLLVH